MINLTGLQQPVCALAIENLWGSMWKTPYITPHCLTDTSFYVGAGAHVYRNIFLIFLCIFYEQDMNASASAQKPRTKYFENFVICA